MSASEFETVSLRKQVLSRLGVFYVDMMNGSGFVDSRWTHLGFSFDDLLNNRWLDRVHPSDRDHARAALLSHLRGETPAFKCEFRVQDDTGEYRWFISAGAVERRERSGAPLTFVGHNEDVTSLHNLREALQRAHRLAEDRATEADALRAAGAVVVASLDAPTAVRSVIQQLESLVPLDTAMVCELEDRELQFVGGASDVTEESFREFAGRRLKTFLKVVKSRLPESVDEPDRPPRHKLFVPLVARGVTVGVLALARESAAFETENVRIAMTMADYLSLALSNARLYSRMQQRAEIDQLSGVLTRRAFLESAEQVMDQAFHTGAPLCCLILDLDHFKSINDTYGHSAGDQVLRTLGSILRDSLRSTDMIGRFGGEEFCALLTKTDSEEGREATERLRVAIAATSFPGVERTITASIGIASLTNATSDGTPAERLSIEQIIKRADVALYHAKENGRDRTVAYETMDEADRSAAGRASSGEGPSSRAPAQGSRSG